MTQHDLIRELATHWHLSMTDRELLPERKVKSFLLCDVIESILRERGWYPPDWRPNLDFDGGVIELERSGRCRIHWKTEDGLMRFVLVAIEEYDMPSRAVTEWLRRMFPIEIDGIQIDWGENPPIPLQGNGP